MKKTILLFFVFLGINATAQTGKILEEIVAVVGENVVLKSELETEYLQAQESMDYFKGDLKSEILNQLIIQKLYLHKGQLDSVYADRSRVNAEVDRRIQYYSQQAGGEQKLEKFLGKSIAEYKALMFTRVEEQMITQQVQQGLVSSLKVSPTEVRRFFKDIPTDSLPIFEPEVQVGQIVMAPSANKYAKEQALTRITEIRDKILAGKYDFTIAASSLSDDKGTAVNGGELGYFGRGQMVGAFEREAFKLRKDTISKVIETDFGYHILQLIDRKGDKVNVRHILIRPVIVNSDYAKVTKQLAEAIEDVKAGKMTFCEAATKYSTDPYTKDNCGYFSNPNTGSKLVPKSILDGEVINRINTLEPGSFSKPEQIQNYDRTTSFRVVYLKEERPEHKANMKDDYQKIQTMALESKQDKEIKNWIKDYKQGVYIWVDDKYRNSKELQDWKGLSN